MELDLIMREPWTLLLWLALGVALVGLYVFAASPGRSTTEGAARASGTDTALPSAETFQRLSFSPVVREAAPAVVNVYTRRVIERSRSPFYDDPFFRHFFGLPDAPSAPRERIQSSLGSGVILRPDGIIVTNNHVIAAGDEFIVALSDRREFEAEVIYTDERVDLAVLRIDTKGEKLPFLPLRDSDTVNVGDIVLAIGNPFGVGQTVTTGIVSALARTQVGISDYQFFIQTDAAVNPGNSGGALITTDGKLIGINTAIFTRTGGSIGIGFAIPSNMVRIVLETAADGGRVNRAWIGVGAQAITSDIARAIGLDRPQGVLVKEVTAGGPADQAGIKINDIILTVDGFEVNDPQSLRYRVAVAGVGKTVQVGYLRGSDRRTAAVTLTRPPENPPRQVTLLEGRHPLAGATVANLSPAFAEELRIEETQGVVVLSTERRSPAARIRLRPGDILLEVNGQRVADVDALQQIMQAPLREWEFQIKRGGEIISFGVAG